MHSYILWIQIIANSEISNSLSRFLPPSSLFYCQWLSCTAHFYQYFRCYSPIAFGKKTDKNGDYIRKWLPQFKNFPTKYIYEPWTAPIEIQKMYGVIIGQDYPEPIVHPHTQVSKSNMQRMKEAYDAHKQQQQLEQQQNNGGVRRRVDDNDERRSSTSRRTNNIRRSSTSKRRKT